MILIGVFSIFILLSVIFGMLYLKRWSEKAKGNFIIEEYNIGFDLVPNLKISKEEIKKAVGDCVSFWNGKYSESLGKVITLMDIKKSLDRYHVKFVETKRFNMKSTSGNTVSYKAYTLYDSREIFIGTRTHEELTYEQQKQVLLSLIRHEFSHPICHLLFGKSSNETSHRFFQEVGLGA